MFEQFTEEVLAAVGLICQHDNVAISDRGQEATNNLAPPQVMAMD